MVGPASRLVAVDRCANLPSGGRRPGSNSNGFSAARGRSTTRAIQKDCPGRAQCLARSAWPSKSETICLTCWLVAQRSPGTVPVRRWMVAAGASSSQACSFTARMLRAAAAPMPSLLRSDAACPRPRARLRGSRVAAQQAATPTADGVHPPGAWAHRVDDPWPRTSRSSAAFRGDVA